VAKSDEAVEKLLAEIVDAAAAASQLTSAATRARALNHLAEALAWLRSPGQPHGGGSGDQS
jgi:hypothetical protein